MIAITGGTGFVGSHVAKRFTPQDVVAISRRTGVDVEDAEAPARALDGCEVVVHCAGINQELGAQSFQRVHVEGTASVIAVATT